MKLFLLSLLSAAAVWSGSTIKEVSTAFMDPPQELASHVIWGWEGRMDIETIRHDLDSIKVKGFKSVIFEAGYHLPYEYLSEGWFEAVRTAVLEAKARGLKVWIIDEGKYPSGFAGGKFTRERPDLRMKALVPIDTVRVDETCSLKGYKVDSRAMSAVAVSASGAPDRVVEIKDGCVDFNAGLGSWDIIFVGWDYRTGQTRAVDNPTGGKDTRNSICDYFSPEAVRQFLDWTHEQYKKYIGEEFGKTVLGFRGDEPDFAYLPWTPNLKDEFESRKGYDPTPFYALLFSRNRSVQARRFRADYFDVWSQLFAENFFGQQSEWCEANGISYVTHLNREHDMPACVRVEGSFFRDLRPVQVPGVDAIWNQIWPGTDNDFPKFASSVSHVYGKQRAFSESFAAYNIPPTIPTAKYAVDYQVARGINFFEFMFWMAGSQRPNWMTDPRMKELNDYTNRLTYLMTQGKPGARVAVYYPTSTHWLEDKSVNADLVETARLLLTHQFDFDWVDDDDFSGALSVRGGAFENLSGQKYTTLVIPSCDVVGKAAWEAIERFSRAGGKVLFWGRKPTMLVGRSFLQPESVPELGGAWAEEPSVEWTNVVAHAMPRPEFYARPVASGSGDTRDIVYTRRSLPDADIYFVFNEGDSDCSFTAIFDAVGIVETWDPATGATAPARSRSKGSLTAMDLHLDPWQSMVVCIRNGDAVFNVRKYGVKSGSKVQTAAIQAVIDKAAEAGGGKVVFPAGKYLSGALFFPQGVDLELSEGAVLKGTANPDDYPFVPTRFEGVDRSWRCAFLNFTDSRGVTVSGKGTVDGNGLEWNKLPRGSGPRPRLICFTRCDGGSVSGLSFRNQASWCLHVLYTNGFDIDGLDIRATDYIPSSDGIDIDSSSDVRVAGTYISVHDDCISIKSGKDAEGRRVARPSTDILIENCHFAYGHGAVTMGSEISGGISRVLARDCVVDGDNWAPFRFKSQPPRGGYVEDIVFERFAVSDVRNIFDISLEWKSSHEKDRQPEYADPVTRLSGVVFRDCHGSGKTMGHFNGFGVAPLTPDVFRFEDCSFEAGEALHLKNAEIDTTGLETTITQ